VVGSVDERGFRFWVGSLQNARMHSRGCVLALVLSDGYLFVSQAVRVFKRIRWCLTKE
jgi:hypothetical protein